VVGELLTDMNFILMSPPYLAMNGGVEKVINFNRMSRLSEIVTVIRQLQSLPVYSLPRVDVVLQDLNSAKIIAGALFDMRWHRRGILLILLSCRIGSGR